MARSDRHDALLGRILRYAWRMFCSVGAIASFLAFGRDDGASIGTIWQYSPWPQNDVYLAMIIAFSAALGISFWPLLTRLFISPLILYDKYQRHSENLEQQKKAEALQHIEKLRRLLGLSPSLERLSRVEICNEKLGKLGFPSLDKLDTVERRIYLDRITPYLEEYGIERAIEEGKRWLGETSQATNSSD
ncbi:MAG: hypothetical protein F4109_07615 [Gammaproteobacteria bacterium]|nr:hypothetical protein [Gammaproteobacteria bacterium]MYD02104.1 hypothetical protein [Gammaproteobacteria bacterium]MYI25278.1 hypothetical protein [Gammaproteobacteria bacterium]